MSARPEMEQRRGEFFGGSSQLRHHYRIIGAALLKFEADTSDYNYRSFEPACALRENLAFLPVEVIESYLESLLDPEVSESELFIGRTAGGWASALVSLAGLMGAIGLGLYAATSGASLMLSFALTVCLAVPFAVLWHYYPKGHLARRMSFARVLSEEIARRRGRDGKLGRSVAFDEPSGRSKAGVFPSAVHN
jgi:hypothetical protein